MIPLTDGKEEVIFIENLLCSRQYVNTSTQVLKNINKIMQGVLNEQER